MDQQDTEIQKLEPLPLKEIAVLLVKHYGLHQGLWDVAIEMRVSIGQLGPSPDAALPGAAVMVSRVGLAKTEKTGPLTVNASELNPASK